MYWDSFFSLSKKAKVYIPEESIEGKRSFMNDMESEKGALWMNQGTRNNTVFHQGQWSQEDLTEPPGGKPDHPDHGMGPYPKKDDGCYPRC